MSRYFQKKYLEIARRLYVKYIYADHNSSCVVRDELKKILDAVSSDDFVLNIGSGNSRIHPNIKNLDVLPGENVDFVATAEKIPLGDEVVDVIITQEAFEHIANPIASIMEAYRVLRPGGTIFFQVPFIIGYHPGPTDYWRFSKEGVVKIMECAGFKVVRTGISVGSASGFYRIFVEFLSILCSGPFGRLYLPFKALFALLLYPVKWLDFYVKYSDQNDRVAGGYFCVAVK